ncbi:MAG: carboxypeptidase-like regulatory domain-containing protein [Mariniphaga sp.]|nr:carboxypeptidase-like regulatory domain-containing protein [Mariniphaga sp.]
MIEKDKHINKEDFIRYLSDKMSNSERYEFESLLQQHPFEAEALEGILVYNSEEITSDLNELKKKIKPLKRSNKFRYWAVAASVLLVISSGVIYSLLNIESPIKEVTESKLDIPEKEEVYSSPEIENESAEEIVDEIVMVEDEPIMERDEILNIAEKLDVEKEIIEIDVPDKETMMLIHEPDIDEISAKKSAAQPASQFFIDGVAANEKRMVVGGLEISSAFNPESTQFIKGKVISADDQSVLPGVNLLAKGTEITAITDSEGKFEMKVPNDTTHALIVSYAGMEQTEFDFYNDSNNIIELIPSEIALNEVVSTRNIKSSKSISKIQDSEAEPLGGYDEFDLYLKEKCKIPENYKPSKKNVRVELTINKSGSITNIEALNSPDSILFERAKEILYNQSKWMPELKNGEPVESEVILKLKFK